jgi:hypothetical protein
MTLADETDDDSASIKGVLETPREEESGYHTFIKKAISLADMKQKVKNGDYRNDADDFETDLRLVLSNAKKWHAVHFYGDPEHYTTNKTDKVFTIPTILDHLEVPREFQQKVFGAFQSDSGYEKLKDLNSKLQWGTRVFVPAATDVLAIRTLTAFEKLIVLQMKAIQRGLDKARKLIAERSHTQCSKCHIWRQTAVGFATVGAFFCLEVGNVCRVKADSDYRVGDDVEAKMCEQRGGGGGGTRAEDKAMDQSKKAEGKKKRKRSDCVGKGQPPATTGAKKSKVASRPPQSAIRNACVSKPSSRSSTAVPNAGKVVGATVGPTGSSTIRSTPNSTAATISTSCGGGGGPAGASQLSQPTLNAPVCYRRSNADRGAQATQPQVPLVTQFHSVPLVSFHYSCTEHAKEHASVV